MIFDHLCTVFDPHSFIGRYTFTRAALPLFCLVAGSLYHRPGFRLVLVALCGCAVTALQLRGFGRPDILLLLALGLLALPATSPALMAVALMQPVTWRLGWSGYQPGTVLALLMAGRMFGRERISAAGEWLPGAFGFIGRWPLVIYCGHLAAFRLLSWA